MRTCEVVANCARKHFANGHCNKHYLQVRRDSPELMRVAIAYLENHQ